MEFCVYVNALPPRAELYVKACNNQVTPCDTSIAFVSTSGKSFALVAVIDIAPLVPIGKL